MTARSLSSGNILSAAKRIIALMILVCVAVASLSVTVNAVLNYDCYCNHVCVGVGSLLGDCGEIIECTDDKCNCPVELCSACEAIVNTKNNKAEELTIENAYIGAANAAYSAWAFVASLSVKTLTIVEANVRMNN